MFTLSAAAGMHNGNLRFAVILIVLAMFAVNAIDANSKHDPHHRVRRKVVFSKNSKIFFRVNGKVNIQPWNEIFAYAYAVRINWDLPETLHRRHKFFKRDLHSELEKIQFDRTDNYQAYACLFTYICKQLNRIPINNDGGKCGIFCSLGKIIAQSAGVEASFFKSIFNKCDYYINVCTTTVNI